MNRWYQHPQMMLAGCLVRAAWGSILDPEKGDVIMVHAPARDEDGNILRPNLLEFPCDLTINGVSYYVSASALLSEVGTVVRVVVRVPGAASSIQLSHGWMDECLEFHFGLLGDRQRFIESLIEVNTSRDSEAKALARLR